MIDICAKLYIYQHTKIRKFISFTNSNTNSERCSNELIISAGYLYKTKNPQGKLYVCKLNKIEIKSLLFITYISHKNKKIQAGKKTTSHINHPSHIFN